MNTIITSSHPANIHSTCVVPAYQQLNETQTTPKTPLLTTHDLLSLIRQDCLVIMLAIEADALETEKHHYKIQDIQRDVAQLKRYYLDAIPLFDRDSYPYAA